MVVAMVLERFLQFDPRKQQVQARIEYRCEPRIEVAAVVGVAIAIENENANANEFAIAIAVASFHWHLARS